ncbi:uncharacterized protein BYT42DRAFT_565911 [Radiomyces spectabilis]|uniref:uncharacterized protein n=1 Tax=Radiomyces spectabilis TaxID=64574 RepID=UPI002220F18A|nr:uncharacterized protein BYT42DRAFT_565911 [Radiomyces spectabilis]KAI8381270.1 hypothetical protein BYT42DRAFT_565911 [Radiomyces spectabilis]
MDSEEANEIIDHVMSIWSTLLRQRGTRPPADNSARCSSTLSSTLTSHTAALNDYNQFLSEIRKHSEGVLRYENQALLDKAMDCIPLQRLYDEAETESYEDDLDSRVIRRLLHWFKHEFFTWVDQPLCDHCGGQTRYVMHTTPTAEDLQYDAPTVELYACLTCKQHTRFPRYNDPGRLLVTRRGRCGEWANCFTLCCRAIGVEARLVFDKTDHVWTEVFSESQQRWIHCDACEEAYDRPLLYSAGWNKQLTYCIAFSCEEVVDVTRRYTRNWPTVLSRRTLVDEDRLCKYLETLSTKRQRQLSDARRLELKGRHAREEQELMQASQRQHVNDDELVGRQSGSLAWRMARGEHANQSGHDPIKKYVLSCEQVVLPNVGDTQHTHLAGTATVLDNGNQTAIVRLTQDEPSQCGGVFCETSLDLTSGGFEVEFAFRITDRNGQPSREGADGLAFVIRGDSDVTLGRGGCDLGYGGLRNSLVIEFDTYKSSDRCADPSGNHISIQGRLPPLGNSAHHDFSLGHTSRIPIMTCGEWIHVRVRVLTGTQQIEISLATDVKGHPTDKDYTPVLTTQVDICRYINHPTNAWIGWTASTGGLSQIHDIQILRAATYQSRPAE